jgi:predicted dehydrogenase
MHWRPLKVEGAPTGGRLKVLETPADLFDPHLAPGEGPHHNVSYAYAAFARDLIHGTHAAADFADALARHRTIDAIVRAAARQQSVPLAPAAEAGVRTAGWQA